MHIIKHTNQLVLLTNGPVSPSLIQLMDLYARVELVYLCSGVALNTGTGVQKQVESD